MHLIVGLGNPGDDYKNTRHNIGFDALDLIASKYNIKINRIKFKGIYGDGIIAGEKVILLKPSTYMNLSGESVIEALNFYKIPKENMIVIYDDISLPVGRMRIRPEGSAGGHNGIKNIIRHLSSESFPRIKVGIGEPKGDLISYVLGHFSKEEREILDKIFSYVSDAVETIIKKGVTEAMNKFNGIKIE
ncbi:peptidyl-tRNA hydrolase, PTH1 family [Clostridium sp. USBA 49]|jgi:PTH1 family peptidyl-tRNA hydrolase|uniref:aminoacyl-tRNA hydrolase n=1 Tax=Clostridium sp. USBA 49 TaxID=1881060 RepID=UPI00099B0E86|nr:aminoacyl-tRNA hydrolase [Clostridium sp. USBA 49]SKA78767.1 peptidyl-tRNA hydrolase, PTH1 family [Clostridium sp. USBA 49]